MSLPISCSAYCLWIQGVKGDNLKQLLFELGIRLKEKLNYIGRHQSMIHTESQRISSTEGFQEQHHT